MRTLRAQLFKKITKQRKFEKNGKFYETTADIPDPETYGLSYVDRAIKFEKKDNIFHVVRFF